MELKDQAFEFLDTINAMNSPMAVIDRLRSAVRPFGYEYMTCVGCFDFNELSKSDVLSDCWPNEWAQRYYEREYFLRDPIALSFTKSARPYTWSEALEMIPCEPDQHQIMAESAEFGLRDGYVIPIMGHANYKAIVGFAGRELDKDPRNLAAMHMMAIYAHDRIRKLRFGSPDRRLPLPVKLSARELECLRWAANGKTNWEIGQILSISENTVTTHIRRAMNKFGVGTRTQAVVLASQLAN